MDWLMAGPDGKTLSDALTPLPGWASFNAACACYWGRSNSGK